MCVSRMYEERRRGWLGVMVMVRLRRKVICDRFFFFFLIMSYNKEDPGLVETAWLYGCDTQHRGAR